MYKINEVFEHGQKRYYVACGGGEIGAFIYKRSAKKCAMALSMNDKITALASKCEHLDDEDVEAIQNILEASIDRMVE